MIDRASLQGRTCLITGATGGIGCAMAHVLAEQGVGLLLTGRNQEKLNRLADSFAGKTEVKVLRADLAVDRDLAILVDMAVSMEIDILINNAGIFPVGSLDATSLSQWDQCHAVNTRAPFVLSQALAKGMVARSWGRIVNIASSSAYAGFADTSTYCASKHGLLGLSRALHAELRPHGVRVYCVSPGSVKTDMGLGVAGQDFDTFMEPDEIAHFVGHLLRQNGNMVSDEVRLNRMIYR